MQVRQQWDVSGFLMVRGLGTTTGQGQCVAFLAKTLKLSQCLSHRHRCIFIAGKQGPWRLTGRMHMYQSHNSTCTAPDQGVTPRESLAKNFKMLEFLAR